jgi:nicotinamide-nucleotide amidase
VDVLPPHQPLVGAAPLARTLSDLPQRIAAALTARHETLAVAETSAGGLISAALIETAGASSWFLGGAVVYSSAAKETWLDLPADIFGADGAVSARAAQVLADTVRGSLGATWGVAETGVAGPQTGRRSAKPAGLAYLAVSGPVSLVREILTHLEGRAENQRSFATAALALLEEALRRAPGSHHPARSTSTAG